MNFQELASSIDMAWLSQKNEKWRELHKKDLMNNLRYAHGGQTFPQEIESFVITFLRNKDIWKPGTRLTRKQSLTGERDSMDLIWYQNSSNNIEAWVLINGVGQTIVLRQVLDTRWSTLKDPVREVLWNGKRYRTVPFNGDLRQHHVYQTGHFEKKFFPTMIKDGIITESQAQHLQQYAEIHDMPELQTGDDFWFAKWNLDQDAVILEHQMNISNIFTENEIAYHTENCRRNEWKHTLFGVGEMLEYLHDAVNSSQYPEYFAHKWRFPVSIVKHTGSKFLDPEKTALLIKEDRTKKDIPYKEISPISLFFDANRDGIQSIIQSCRENQKDILSLGNTTLQKPDDIDAVDKLVNDLYDAYKL